MPHATPAKAEIIPIEPDPGNAGEGNRRSANDTTSAPTPGAGSVPLFPFSPLKNLLVSGAALLALPLAAWAQGPVSGTITDAQTGTALPGATVLLDGAPSAATDAAGAFAIPAVPVGTHEVRITFVGYEPLVQQMQGQAAAQRLNVTLRAGGVLTGEALITAQRANDRTATAYTNLSKQDLAKRNFGQDLPYLLDQTPP